MRMREYSSLRNIAADHHLPGASSAVPPLGQPCCSTWRSRVLGDAAEGMAHLALSLLDTRINLITGLIVAVRGASTTSKPGVTGPAVAICRAAKPGMLRRFRLPDCAAHRESTTSTPALLHALDRHTAARPLIERTRAGPCRACGLSNVFRSEGHRWSRPPFAQPAASHILQLTTSSCLLALCLIFLHPGDEVEQRVGRYILS